MPKLTTTQHLEEVINSGEYATFCEHQCPLSNSGCRNYCPIFTLREKLGGAHNEA